MMKQWIKLTVVWLKQSGFDYFTGVVWDMGFLPGWFQIRYRQELLSSHSHVLTIPKTVCRTFPLWITSWNDCNLFIQQSRVNTFIQQSTSRGQWWWMKRLGKIKRGAYMFLPFDPLVSLLNSLQVLKMQLHQSVNLEREWNGGRQRRSEGSSMQQSSDKNERKGESKKKENRMRLRGQIWDTVLILFLLVMYWFFSAAGLYIVTGMV